MGMRSLSSGKTIQSKPKKTRQGKGTHTKCVSLPGGRRNKRYRGQGK